MVRTCMVAVTLALALALGGCGGDDAKPAGVPQAGGGPSAASGPAAPSQPAADPMATPKGSIEHQLSLLAAGDVAALRACFTARLQDRITEEAVAQGQREAASMTIDDLFASMTEGEYEGKQTAKVQMKNGRTLTTLVLTDGRWLSDTIWFR